MNADQMKCIMYQTMGHPSIKEVASQTYHQALAPGVLGIPW